MAAHSPDAPDTNPSSSNVTPSDPDASITTNTLGSISSTSAWCACDEAASSTIFPQGDSRIAGGKWLGRLAAPPVPRLLGVLTSAAGGAAAILETVNLAGRVGWRRNARKTSSRHFFSTGNPPTHTTRSPGVMFCKAHSVPGFTAETAPSRSNARPKFSCVTWTHLYEKPSIYAWGRQNVMQTGLFVHAATALEHEPGMPQSVGFEPTHVTKSPFRTSSAAACEEGPTETTAPVESTAKPKSRVSKITGWNSNPAPARPWGRRIVRRTGRVLCASSAAVTDAYVGRTGADPTHVKTCGVSRVRGFARAPLSLSLERERSPVRYRRSRERSTVDSAARPPRVADLHALGRGLAARRDVDDSPI